MLLIDDYIDAARARQDFKSDRQLAAYLGLSSAAVPYWRTRRTWPADTTMIRLAEAAGIDPTEALLDLNAWRADTPAVRSVYERIAEKMAATAAALVVCLSVQTYTAARPTGQGTVYIMENRLRRLRRMFAPAWWPA